MSEIVSFADPACRLLTILGAGGMGKTRLAIAAASTLMSDFTDGVAYVPLAATPIKPSENAVNPLIGVLADVLNMSFYGEARPERQLLNYLRRKELLLVLDNFEHLLDTAGFISDLLSTAPDIKMIVTSRDRLNLQEEWLYPLHGLSFPKERSKETKQSYSIGCPTRRLRPSSHFVMPRAGIWKLKRYSVKPIHR